MDDYDKIHADHIKDGDTNADKKGSDDNANQNQRNKPLVNEVMLELCKQDNQIILRESKDHEAVLAKIEFSDKICQMLGEDMPMVGERMIELAVASMVQRQMATYHANVLDEESDFIS